MPVIVPALMVVYVWGTDRQVKQYTVYDKYDTCYDWDMLHRLCETRRETLRSGTPSELTQMWAKLDRQTLLSK